MRERILIVNIVSDAGVAYIYEFKEANARHNNGYYKPEDRVLKLRALKFPVKCPIDPEERVLCPKCGNQMKAGARHCPLCRTNFEEKKSRY